MSTAAAVSAARYGAAFANAVLRTLADEGTFSDHALDPGGATMYGITEAEARRHGYQGEMRKLPLDLAIDIYAGAYWRAQKLDAVAAFSAPVAAEIFDTTVNCGAWWGAALTQAALQLFGHSEVVLDGKLGPVTVAAIKGEVANGHERHLILAANGMQFVKYVVTMPVAFRAFMGLARAGDTAKRRAFIRGWMKRTSVTLEV